MPRYEFKEGTSNKFWEITRDGTSFTTRYGKIGTDGQESTKDFDSEEKCKKEYDKIVAEKTKKGYELVSGGDDEGADEEDGAEDEDGGDDAPASKGLGNPDLEAAILKNPNDADAYLVYGDWLQSKGDPRGELIVVQHALHAKPEFRKFQELSRTEAALMEKHKSAFMPSSLAERESLVKSTWFLGFMKSLRIGLDYDTADEGVQMPDLIKAALNHPSGRFLQELTIGMASFDGENEYQSTIDLLVSLKKPQTLRKIFIGDFEYPDETEMSWSHLGDVGKLWKTFPKLESVTLQSGSMTLGTIDLPECREFVVRTGGLDEGSITSIINAKWPKLEKLEVWFGSENYGAAGTADMIQPIFDAKGLGKVKHLGLKNAEFTDDIAKLIAGSKILKQLETLDLSMGCLTIEGAKAIVAHKDAFKHLKVLNVEDNAMSDEAVAMLEGVAKEVRTGSQSEDRVEEDSRYTSVGE